MGFLGFPIGMLVMFIIVLAVNFWVGWSPFTPLYCPRCGQWLSRDGLKRLALERKTDG